MSPLPSVTTILKPFSDFSKIPAAVLQNAADRGSVVHSLVARRMLGLMIFPEEITDEVAGYFRSFEVWFEAMVETVVMAEKTLTDLTQGYHGTPDAIVRMKGDAGLTMLDWKTPIVTAKSWRIQIAAYQALAEKSGYEIKRIATLQLHPKGRRAKFTEYTHSTLRDFAIFLSALNCWRYFHEPE